MPDWTYSTTSGSTWENTEEDGFYVSIPYFAQQQYEGYKQMCEQQECRWEQAYEEEMLRLEEEKRLVEELREDKRKYPLFYWRELTDGDS